MKHLIKTFLCLSLLLQAVLSFSGTKVVYYHHDVLGSAVAATDERGEVIWREEYEAYGDRLIRDSGSDENTLWYTGKQEEFEFGLQYFDARWYDPSLGAFISRDPVGAVQHLSIGNIHGFNSYIYGNNNPYKFIDPDGRSPTGIPTGQEMEFLRSDHGLEVAETIVESADTISSIMGGPSAVSVKASVKKGVRAIVERFTKGGRNLPFTDKDRVTEINKTLDRIDGNGPFPHKRDGITFKNREGKLPEGNYKEYTVDTPGASNRGARRILIDQDSGNTYYTDDHYKNFIQIDPTKN